MSSLLGSASTRENAKNKTVFLGLGRKAASNKINNIAKSGGLGKNPDFL